MVLFSEREGFKSVRSTLQIDFIDNGLRNALWNELYDYYFIHIEGEYLSLIEEDMKYLIELLWRNYFKIPVDELKSYFRPYKKIKNYFFKCEWYEVYDFIEFLINKYDDENLNLRFIRHCNIVLERELSAYRFVNKQITKITSEEEISEIEESTEEAPNPVSIHLNKSLELLSDRKSPDYRNSIKESISAIESICKLIVKDDKATLGRALNKLDKKKDVELHENLKNAFHNLYKYTSDSDGIRHALLDKPNLDFEDAKFMLVSCSAFTNYLLAKAAKSDIKL